MRLLDALGLGRPGPGAGPGEGPAPASGCRPGPGEGPVPASNCRPGPGEGPVPASGCRPGPGAVIALVGGGGKTSLGHRLVREAWGTGLRAVFTVTTKIFPPDLPPDQWVAGPSLPDGKLSGLSFDEVAALRERFDLVVVEADGSAGRPLKFPAAHEPVIPPFSTHVLAVAGASVVGRPLSAEWVHRPELAPAAAAVVTPALVADVLWNRSAKGWAVIPVVNQADSPERLAAARAVGQALLEIGAPLVLLTAAHAEPPVVQRLALGRDLTS